MVLCLWPERQTATTRWLYLSMPQVQYVLISDRLHGGCQIATIVSSSHNSSDTFFHNMSDSNKICPNYKLCVISPIWDFWTGMKFLVNVHIKIRIKFASFLSIQAHVLLFKLWKGTDRAALSCFYPEQKTVIFFLNDFLTRIIKWMYFCEWYQEWLCRSMLFSADNC